MGLINITEKDFDVAFVALKNFESFYAATQQKLAGVNQRLSGNGWLGMGAAFVDAALNNCELYMKKLTAILTEEQAGAQAAVAKFQEADRSFAALIKRPTDLLGEK